MFAETLGGESDEYIKDELDELAVEFNLDSLWMTRADAQALFPGLPGRCQGDRSDGNPVWMSSNLKALDWLYAKYGQNNLWHQNAEDVKSQISELLNIVNEQKIGNAFDVVCGDWSSSRRGIFGTPSDGDIDLLGVAKKLAEIDYEAKENGYQREYYTGPQRNDEKYNKAFKERGNNAFCFTLWVEVEVSVFPGKKWGALSKHLSEFIRN